MVYNQQHEFLFFFQDSQNRFYKMVNGVLELNYTPMPLIFSPDGWQEMVIENVRNERYFGLDRMVTIPFKFVGDGAGILKTVRYTYGVNADIQMVIMQRRLEFTGPTFGFWHKEIFRADVDLSTFTHSGFTVSCTLLEGGLPKFIKANEKTTYELELKNENAINIKMDGIKLHESLNFADVDGVDFNATTVFTDGLTPTAFVNKEGDSINVLYQTQNILNTSSMSLPDIISQDNCLMQNLSAVDLVCRAFGRVEFVGVTQTSPPWALRIRFLTSQSATVTAPILFSSSFVPGQVVGGDFDVTFTLRPGDRLYRQGVFFGGISGNPGVEFTTNSRFKVEFITRQATTYIRGFRPGYVLQQLIEKMTEGKYTVDTTGLLFTDRNKIFTSGDGIRGLAEGKLKISLDTFFSFFDVFRDAGLGLTAAGKVRISKKVDMVDYTSVTDLGEISGLNVSVPTDKMFNIIKVGYPDSDQEGVNGRQSFCNTYEFNIPAQIRAPKPLDKTTTVITDCYQAELVRTAFLDKTSTDSNQDNKNYVLHIEYDEQPASGAIPVHYLLDRSLNASATGLLEAETVFNIGLSPKRCLLNNGGYIHSCLDKLDSKRIVFQSTPKNQDVAAGGIVEKGDVIIGTLDSPYFSLHLMEIQVGKNVLLEEQLDTNPLGLYSFTVDGEPYVGIPLRMSIQPADKETQTYRLLAGKDTDMKRLITYYG